MRVAIRYSEYKSTDKLPHKEKFDCKTCFDTPKQDKRNCRGKGNKKYKYIIGSLQFSRCPVSVFIFDSDVNSVIDLIITSMDTGIPVSGNCLLDQTPAFFDYLKIIQHERYICHEELRKLQKIDDERETAAAKRSSGRSKRG